MIFDSPSNSTRFIRILPGDWLLGLPWPKLLAFFERGTWSAVWRCTAEQKMQRIRRISEIMKWQQYEANLRSFDRLVSASVHRTSTILGDWPITALAHFATPCKHRQCVKEESSSNSSSNLVARLSSTHPAHSLVALVFSPKPSRHTSYDRVQRRWPLRAVWTVERERHALNPQQQED